MHVSLGRLHPELCDQILLVSGTPFCKDDRDYLFRGKCYYSYPFPLADDLKEALDIIVPTQASNNGSRRNPCTSTRPPHFGCAG